MTTISRQAIIYNDLCDALNAGRLARGDNLPSLRELSQTYQSSLGTVRAALLKLQHEGRIVARHGSGYYVTPRNTLRSTLLIAPTEGDMWADYVQRFSRKLAARADTRLILEPPPAADDIAAFQGKLECYLAEGLDSIIIDAFVMMDLEFLRSYLPQVRIICYNDDYLSRKWDCPKVLSDSFHGGYIGTRHLLDQGAHSIVFLVPPTFHSEHGGNQREAFAGCQQAIADSGGTAHIKPFSANAFASNFADLVDEELAARGDVDAIFSFCDFRFEHVIPRLTKAGLRIPDDIKLLGYFDTPWCQQLKPELSSINTQPEAIVDHVVRIWETGDNGVAVVRPKLVVRASTVGT